MNVICWNKLGVSPANICCLTNSTWTQATVSGPSRAWWTGEWPAKFKKIHGTNRKTVGKYFGIYHGWWFQTWILLSISYIVCHPSHWLIFFRGVKTTSQMVLVYHGSIMFESLATGLSCLYAFKHLRYDPFADWDATGCAWKWEDCPLYLGGTPNVQAKPMWAVFKNPAGCWLGIIHGCTIQYIGHIGVNHHRWTSNSILN